MSAGNGLSCHDIEDVEKKLSSTQRYLEPYLDGTFISQSEYEDWKAPYISMNLPLLEKRKDLAPIP